MLLVTVVDFWISLVGLLSLLIFSYILFHLIIYGLFMRHSWISAQICLILHYMSRKISSTACRCLLRAESYLRFYPEGSLIIVFKKNSYLYYIFSSVFDEIDCDFGPKLVLYDSKIFSFDLVSIIRSSSFRLINISWGSISWLFCNPADLWSSSYYQVYLICFYFNCL